MQQRVNDQPAYILHRRDFKESSLILEVFTEQYGRLGLVAKSARKRRDAAHFQPFNRLVISWAGKGELKTLIRIDSQPITLVSSCYLPAFYVNELLLYLLPKQDEHELLFKAYQKFLHEISADNMEPMLRSFEIQLLTELGLLPDLQYQSDNGENIEPNRHYYLDLNSGILPAQRVDSSTFTGSELDAISRQQFDTKENLLVAKRLLKKIIDFNLQGRTLQSRKLYQQLHEHQ